MGDAVAKATMLFTLVFAFSLVIERFLEVLKSAYDMLDSRYDWHKRWTARAERIRDFLERRLRIFEYVSPDQATAFIARFSEMLVVPRSEEHTSELQSRRDLVCRLLLEKKKKNHQQQQHRQKKNKVPNAH